MTTLEHIVKAIEPLGIPYSPGVYNGPEKRWITYNYVDDYGNLFGDDEPLETVNRIQVHYFLPVGESFSKMKGRIREALLREGFTYPEVESMDDPNPELRHLVFECEIEEEREEELWHM